MDYVRRPLIEVPFKRDPLSTLSILQRRATRAGRRTRVRTRLAWAVSAFMLVGSAAALAACGPVLSSSPAAPMSSTSPSGVAKSAGLETLTTEIYIHNESSKTVWSRICQDLLTDTSNCQDFAIPAGMAQARNNQVAWQGIISFSEEGLTRDDKDPFKTSLDGVIFRAKNPFGAEPFFQWDADDGSKDSEGMVEGEVWKQTIGAHEYWFERGGDRGVKVMNVRIKS